MKGLGGLQSEGILSIMMGKPWGQVYEGVGHIALSVRVLASFVSTVQWINKKCCGILE